MADPYGPIDQSYINANKLNMLAMEKTAAETQHYQALAQQEMQKAASEKQQMEQKQRAQAAMQKAALETAGQTAAQQTEAMARAGRIQGATDELVKLSQIQEHLASADSHEANAQGKRLESLNNFYTNLGRRAENLPAGDQVGYKNLIKQIEDATGKPLPDGIRNATWDEKTRQTALDWIAKSKEGMDEKRANAKQVQDAKESESRIREQSAATALKVAQEKAVEKKTAADVKVGGKNSGLASPLDVKTAEGLMANGGAAVDDKGHLMDQGAAAVAKMIAMQAATAVAKNKGLDMPTALQNAYQAALDGKAITESMVEEKHTFAANKMVKQNIYDPMKVGQKKSGWTEAKPADATDAEWAAYQAAKKKAGG